MEKLKKTKPYPIALLTVVVLVSVSLLMALNSVTAPIIEARREAEIQMMLENIFPQMTDFVYQDDLYYIMENDQEAGYAFIAAGSGYGGEMSIIVGLDTDMRIKDISIISHQETPGLGSKIQEEAFTDQFKGLDITQIDLTRDQGQIDAITGATVSSEAVVQAIKEEMEQKLQVID